VHRGDGLLVFDSLRTPSPSILVVRRGQIGELDQWTASCNVVGLVGMCSVRIRFVVCEIEM